MADIVALRLLPEAADDRRCGTRRREFDPNLPPADAKANPDKINMASGGNGNVTHLVLLGGQVPVLFTGVPSAIEYIRAGRPRALGVTSARRLGVLSDVPTLGQFLPGCDADDWKGIGAPKNTPPEIIDMLNEEINAALADPKFKARLVYLGGVPMSMTAAEFGKFVRNGKMGQGNPRGKHQALARPIRGSIFHIIRSANLSAIDPDTRMSAFPIADMPMASGKFG